MNNKQYKARNSANKIKNTNNTDKQPNITGERARCIVKPRYVEQIVGAEAYDATTRQISIKDLSPKNQRKLWEGIKSNNPTLANLMSGNELVRTMKEVFFADWVMDRAEVEEYLGAKGE